MSIVKKFKPLIFLLLPLLLLPFPWYTDIIVDDILFTRQNANGFFVLSSGYGGGLIIYIINCIVLYLALREKKKVFFSPLILQTVLMCLMTAFPSFYLLLGSGSTTFNSFIRHNLGLYNLGYYITMVCLIISSYFYSRAIKNRIAL